MKTYKYEVRMNKFHGEKLAGRTNSLARAEKLANCGDCTCGGGQIIANGQATEYTLDYPQILIYSDSRKPA